jgi:hypothetical protein
MEHEFSTSASDAVNERSRRRRLLCLSGLVCGLFIAAGSAMPVLTGTTRTPPVVLGDASEAHIVEIRDLRGRTVAFGEFRSRLDGLGGTEKDAALIDRRGRTVIGEVELEIPAPGRRDRRTELEVDIIGLPARQRFDVVIDDRTVGTFATDDRGSVDMELQEGEVPPAENDLR